MGNAQATKEAIQASGMKEFLEKGFEQASLRRIARNAGVTTGAFYKYYASKEALFAELVEPHANAMFALYDGTLEQFEAQTPEEQTSTMLEYSVRGMDSMVDYLYDHYDNFILLLCKADGTRYANFVHELTVREVDSTLRYIETMQCSGQPIQAVDRELCHMISSGFFTAVFEILIHNMKKEDAKKRVNQLKTFHTGGWEKLFGISFK